MGDIVKVLRYYGDDPKAYYGYTAVIEWCGSCCFGYRLQFIGIGNNERLGNAKRLEVIGNIYENPDLLTP